MVTSISQRYRFECSYIYDTADMHHELNSTSYILEATVESTDSNTTSIPFETLESMISISVPSKRFLYEIGGWAGAIKIARTFEELGLPVEGYDVPICAEAIVNRIAEKLQNNLDSYFTNLLVTQVKLRENSESYAIWRR